MPTHGDLSVRVAFDQRSKDANGDRLGAWDEVFQRQAQVTFLRGGEGVQQQRLAGRQPIVVTVRRCPDTLAVDNAWRVRLVDEGGAYEITAAQANADAPREFRDFLATETKGG